MRNRGTKFVERWCLLTLIVAGALLLPSARGLSQESQPAAPAAAATADAPAKASSDEPAGKGDEKTATPSTDQPQAKTTESAAPPVAAPAAKAAPPENQAPASTAAPKADENNPPSKESSLPAGKSEPSLASKAIQAAGVKPEQSGTAGWNVWVLAIVLLALFVLPIMAGNYLARAWKMPDHGWKFSLVIGTLAGSILICLFGQFKFGPDLAGGITLIYELADAPTAATANQASTQPNGAANSGQIRSGGREFDLPKLIAALKMRLDPDGTKEITIREYGPAVEIIIPQTGPDEMEFVKRRITDLGQLEFRITADPSIPKDVPRINLAKLTPPGQKDVMQGDEKVAEWVPYDVNEFGPVDQPRGMVKRMAGDTPEALVLMDPFNVTGDYLTSATKGLDERGGPAVHFQFNRAGAQRFEKLTSQNLPNPATPEAYRNLGIILDNKLVNAPRIHTTISDRGMISGGSMTDREVEHTIEVLNAGSLPAALNKTPISEEIISPTLGAVTIQKGKVAIGVSFAAVILFMIVYYRFAGIIACIALGFNLLLVLALMVMIKAAFTLPGLAGLVLTIGMTVDANVLIYERMREELKSGAALRMAIRNGFSRAMTAIIDSNVTNIITAIVLFYLGTDQVKGFAVTLILGLITSLYTAIFVARLMFDICERRGWITQLKMMKILSEPHIDFLGARWVAIGASFVVILVGMGAAYSRGTQLLDIDFTGGSSVTFTLKESAKLPIAKIRDALADTELNDKNLLIVERGNTNTRYTIDTSEQSVEAVKAVIQARFGDKLMTYSLKFSDVAPFKEGDFSGTEAKLSVNSGLEYAAEDGVSHDALREWIRKILSATGHAGIQPKLTNPNYRTGSSARYREWTARFPGLDETATKDVLGRLQKEMQAKPLFPLANKIGGRVSQKMQTNALLAVFVSLVSVVIYLWLRFQKVSYGLAAAIAVAHDVLVTIGMMALSAYFVNAMPGVAKALKIDSFQISLTIVAALLTIIGYSLNDTIVTFDRLREIKGKSPRVTPQMVNASVNQCLSRTILTATTVFLVVVILYLFGGEGIHSFAFAFLVGIVAGTYSTVYIAAPVLLWLSGASAAPAAEVQSTRRMEPAAR